MRVLIVEDDFTSRLLLHKFLSDYGECHVAVNGTEAAQAFQRAKQEGQKYDLICMDIMMPEMDGQRALREIRALEQAAGTLSGDEVRVIMTTGLEDTKNLLESFQGWCDAYLTKPIDTAKLLGHLKPFALIA
jgi:two-component system chemotaxis response regulator CheY